MAAEQDIEEKEHLVSEPKNIKLQSVVSEQFKDVMIEIDRGSNKTNNKEKKKASEIKRTYTKMDKLPQNFKQTIIDGTYDKRINMEEGQGYINGCKQNGNWCSWIWVLCIYMSLILLIIYSIKNPSNNSHYLLLIPLFGGWIIYTIEWYFLSSTSSYLEHIESKHDVIKMVNNLTSSEPEILWILQCYHYEKGGHDGNQQIKKITKKIQQKYKYNQCRDRSIKLLINKYRLTKLTMFKTFEFADNETRKDYDEKFNKFCEENKSDNYQHVDIIMKLNGFKPRVLVDNIGINNNDNLDKQSKFWNVKWFNIFSCLLCSPCYRTQFNSKTGYKSYIIQKEITIKPIFEDEIADI